MIDNSYMKFTRHEVSKHNSLNSAWIIINNNVFDITEYIFHHPGKTIINHLGKDATNAFNNEESHNNFKYMNVFINRYKIGEIVKNNDIKIHTVSDIFDLNTMEFIKLYKMHKKWQKQQKNLYNFGKKKEKVRKISDICFNKIISVIPNYFILMYENYLFLLFNPYEIYEDRNKNKKYSKYFRSDHKSNIEYIFKYIENIETIYQISFVESRIIDHPFIFEYENKSKEFRHIVFVLSIYVDEIQNNKSLIENNHVINYNKILIEREKILIEREKILLEKQKVLNEKEKRITDEKQNIKHNKTKISNNINI